MKAVMPAFHVTVSDAAARWLGEQASARGTSAEALIAQLVEAASQQDALTWEEGSALQCFTAMRAGPGVSVPIKSLWHHWARVAPGATNEAFGAAFDSLAGKGLVLASDASGSAFSLTPAGYKAAQAA